MSKMTRGVHVTSAVALTLSLSACGGGDYCGAIEDSVDRLSGWESAEFNPEIFSDLADVYQDVADAAPEDVQADWQTAADSFSQLAETEDIESMDDEAMEAVDELDSAFQNITQSALDECDISI